MGGLGLADVEQMLDKHSKRCAPVPDVILTYDRMTHPAQQPHRRVAYDRRPEMTDVHLFGGVRPGIVDDDHLGRRHGSDTQALVGKYSLEQALQCGLGQVQVDEPRPGHLDRVTQIVELGDPCHLGGDFTRVAAEAAGQREGRVRLVVRPLRPPDGGVDLFTGDGREGRTQPLVEKTFQARHVRESTDSATGADRCPQPRPNRLHRMLVSQACDVHFEEVERSRMRISTTPSARRRQATTGTGHPIKSAPANLTLTDQGRSSTGLGRRGKEPDAR